MSRLAGFLRMPGGAIVVAVVCIPLIRLLPNAGIFVVLAALCLYPILDVSLLLTRKSWWLGAIVSVIVWFLLFVTLVETAESVRRLGDDAMVFLFPFMLYPIALVISGVVRLEGRVNGRPRESGPRRAAIAVSIAFALAIAVPLFLNIIPVVIWKITGNSPRNTVFSGDGEVVSTAPERVSVQMSGKPAETFHIGADTKFDFRGPGSIKVDGPAAGPVWLKAGQRVNLEYIYRGGEAQAQNVNIWIERKGCAGDAKWTAASEASISAPQGIASLAGTTWEGRVGAGDEAGRTKHTTFEFLDDGRLTYGDTPGEKNTNGRWKQNGPAVLVEVGDCYAEYEGRIEGDAIAGEFSNEMGARDSWTARRTIVSGSAATPK